MESTEDKHLSKRSSLSILLSGKDSTSEKTTNEEIWYDSSIPVNRSSTEGRGNDYRNDDLNENTSPNTSKISCKDLIMAIYENELCGSESEEEPNLTRETNSPLLDKFSLLAAEEDGTPMDDLPEFSTNSDVLAMGIEDFVLVNKKSSEKLVHVRITQGGDRSLTKIKNGSTFPVMQYSEVEAELSKQPSLGFLDMYRQDSDVSATDESVTSPRTIDDSGGYEVPKMFRTQSEDELFAANGGEEANRHSADHLANSCNSTEQRMSDYKNSFEATSSYSTNASESLRKRSWSENLIISCRRPGSDHWSSPKNIVVGYGRKRSQSSGVQNIIKTPKQKIPTSNGFVDHEITGLNLGNNLRIEATNGVAASKRSDMKYFIDTGIDPLKQYRSEQEIMHLRSTSSGSSLPNDDMILSLNPHTSSSKLVLTPTNSSTGMAGSRPGSAVVSNAPTPSSVAQNTNGHKVNSRLPPAGKSNVLSTKELAAYFDDQALPVDRTYSSDDPEIAEADGSEYDSGEDNVFSFVDSPEAPKMYSKSSGSKHITSNESVDTTAKGSSINDDEPNPAYSSGSDYSASDYEALHKIQHEMALFHLHNGYPSGSPHARNRSSSEGPSKHLSYNGTSSASLATEGRRRTSSEHPPTERRPSWFQSVFGMLSGQISPSKKPSPMHRNSATSNSDNIPGVLQYNSKDSAEEDEGEMSFVKDLDTGNVIELDEDGDGAVTAILISPDQIYGGK